MDFELLLEVLECLSWWRMFLTIRFWHMQLVSVIWLCGCWGFVL